MQISVFSDVVCPWCFIGKRRLERALDEMGASASVSIEWLPFELNPQMPAGGMPRAEYLAHKFGPERAAAMQAQIGEVGAQEGIAFAFDRIARSPNTRRAHMLIAYASGEDRGPAAAEALFTAYFEEGRDIGEEAVLLGVAEEVGLDRSAAKAAIEDLDLRRLVTALESRAAELGITGVPFFIIDGKWAVSGAQPTDAWVEALQRIAAQPQQ